MDENQNPQTPEPKKKEPKKKEVVDFATFIQRLDELVEDSDSQNKFVGPTSVKALKGVLKFLVDAAKPKPAMRYKVPPVKKLFRH